MSFGVLALIVLRRPGWAAALVRSACRSFPSSSASSLPAS